MTRGMTNRVALLSGAVIASVGFVSPSFVASSKSLLVFSLPMLFVGAGVVIASIPYGNLFIKEAPPDQFGPVTSARTTVGQFFYSIGIAVSTIVIDKLTRGGVVAKLEAPGVPPSQTGEGIDAVTAYAAQSTAPTTSLGQEALRDATASYASAFGTMMVITGVLCLIAGLIAFALLKRASIHDEQSATPSKPAAAPATAS